MVYQAPLEGQLVDVELEENIKRWGVIGGIQRTLLGRHLTEIERGFFKDHVSVPGADLSLDIIDV